MKDLNGGLDIFFKPDLGIHILLISPHQHTTIFYHIELSSSIRVGNDRDNHSHHHHSF